MSGTVHLELSGVNAGYRAASVLHDMSFAVETGEIAAIVGANGAGKSTLLGTIAGLVRPTTGKIRFDGTEIQNHRAHDLPERGLVLVPEGGKLFPFMTVAENLTLGAYTPKARGAIASRMEEICEIFPILKERRDQLAGRLSGGERQMCAIGRALMSSPSMLMLDEPSVGLSPLMTERVLETVARLAKEENLTVLIVEQRVTEVLEIADRAHILDHGRIVKSDRAQTLLHNKDVRQTYMGLN
ncbi:ABC transporter ATP-binding protein [Mesorhizobium australicum]|uniref:Amino acid/amide ABC transporter ATP-binding protein 2, HAAT family n=1 Tax=Mesorhizobium australicum TaxID=536018 RepID=A0A1X7N1V3_9HYPH|nr:ABC transporter ATP-binding protein [Mesorhizobium australicum]SMH30627.1 amino acid/amide ABC transporter ATP-binding protein 2, HAAT family [Mesorhizobium australicum]